MKNIFKYLAYLFFSISIGIAYFSGMRRGQSKCIDFDVLPIIHNIFTAIICLSLMAVGILLYNKYNN